MLRRISFYCIGISRKTHEYQIIRFIATGKQGAVPLVHEMDEAGCASSLTHVLLLCMAALGPFKKRLSGAQNHYLCSGRVVQMYKESLLG